MAVSIKYCVLLLALSCQVIHSRGGYLKDQDLLQYIPKYIQDDQAAMLKLEREFKNSNLYGREDGEVNRNFFLEWLYNLLGITTTTTPPPLNPPESCPPCKCGKTNTRIRIVGGMETQVNEYPWIALLMYNGKFYCGGSLLNDRYVVTAGHCTKGFRASQMSIKLLEHKRSSSDETQLITRTVERLLVHSRYSSANYDNDIALLKLNETVEFSNFLKPICMPTSGKSFTGHDGVAIGWGTLEEGGTTSDTLQEVTVPIISNEKCKEYYGRERITDNMLCAGYEEGGKDSCQGDSGGPLQVFNTTTSIYMLSGVTSWGEGCAKPEKPGVYTRVNRYITWLKKNTADACYCSP